MGKYLWKVNVRENCGFFVYRTYSKVFSSKQSAMNFVVRQRNKGNDAYLTKWYGN